jgi:superfamily II RNA helicase
MLYTNKSYPFPLDQFQIRAAEALLERKSVLVTAPTGSGKTVIAEFAIFDALDRNLKTIYTTPLKALSNQKFRDLSEQYGSNNVGLLTGDVSINSGAKILVMTTEILRNILYQDISRTDDVLYVILDECHYMNDRERGTVWEEIVIHCPSHILFVALSATVSNAKELAGWITSIHNQTVIIDHPHRPVPIEHLYFTKGKVISLLGKDGDKNTSIAKNDMPYRKPSDVNTTLLLKELRDRNLLPAIYFVFSRRGCDQNLDNTLMAKLNLVTKEERNKILDIVKKVERENPSLYETSPITKKLMRALPQGIAVHHAGLVPIMRHLVEILFQKNLIKVVFATETLAAGINMPARTTVISSLSKRGDFGHEVLSVNSFTQMTGRAGRRGKDDVGYCVIVDDGKEPYSEAVRLVQSPPDNIKSNFTISYNMALNLLRNFTSEEIKNILRKSFGQYVSNKEIIDLKLDLEQQQQSIEKYITPCDYKPQLKVSEMPLIDYENILDSIAYQERHIRHLQEEFEDKQYQRMKDLLAQARKGSIIVIETDNGINVLAVLISTYSERSMKMQNGSNFYAIILTNKGVSRITPNQCVHIYKDTKHVFLPDDIYAQAYNIRIGSWITDKSLKKPFDKNENKRYLRNFSGLEYPRYLKEEIDRLDEIHIKRFNHECHNCPILDNHLNSHQKFRNITKEISDLKENIEFRRQMYINEFRKYVNVLLHYEQLDQDSEGEYRPNKEGLITSYIRADNELAISLMLNKGLLDNLSPIEISGVIATLIFEPRRASYVYPDRFPRKVKTAIKNLEHIISDLKYIQELEGIEKNINVELEIVELIMKWAEGCNWKDLFNGNNLDDGDAIRAIRRIIDLLHQLKNIPDVSLTLQQKFVEAIYRLDRDLITVNIEEETGDPEAEKKDPDKEITPEVV